MSNPNDKPAPAKPPASNQERIGVRLLRFGHANPTEIPGASGQNSISASDEKNRSRFEIDFVPAWRHFRVVFHAVDKPADRDDGARVEGVELGAAAVSPVERLCACAVRDVRTGGVRGVTGENDGRSSMPSWADIVAANDKNNRHDAGSDRSLYYVESRTRRADTPVVRVMLERALD
jgi:hypothetical protein